MDRYIAAFIIHFLIRKFRKWFLKRHPEFDNGNGKKDEPPDPRE